MSPRPRKQRPVPIRQASKIEQQQAVNATFEQATQGLCNEVFEAVDHFESGDILGGIAASFGGIVFGALLGKGITTILNESHKQRRRR